MTVFNFRTAAAAALAGIAFVVSPVTAEAGDVQVGDLVVSHAWTRVTPPGAKVAGGFLTITNKGNTADRLVGGTSPIAGHVEIHEMSMDGGVMKMRELPKGLEIAPGATVELKPGSYHVMFMDLRSNPAIGSPVTGTLKFEKAGEAKISYDVAPLGSKSNNGMDHGKMGHGDMDHSKMDHGKMEHGMPARDMKAGDEQHGKH